MVGVHTHGVLTITGVQIPLGANGGHLITKNEYDAIIAAMDGNLGAGNGANLPYNIIIGSDPGFFSFLTGSGDDFIDGSYRREFIQGKDGNDSLLGAGSDDRLDGGDGVDQALFSGKIADYTITITDGSDPDNPEVEIAHTGGTMANGKDAIKNVEFAVFEFEDGQSRGDSGFGVDDDGKQLFVPLLADPDDPTKLRDGELLNVGQDVKDVNDDLIGSLSVEIPAFMFDGDVEYTLMIGAEENILYNFVYIVDSSGSMSGGNIAETKAAYAALTQSLIDQGVADRSQFAVVDFDSSARLFANLDAQGAIAAVNGLVAGGGTNFGPALITAENWFESLQNVTAATNIAYFLSDGFGGGASDSLQVVNEGPDQAIVDVRAFGIGSGADLNSLNTIDSGNAVLLVNPSDLTDAFSVSGFDKSKIDRIDVKLDGNVVDTIAPNQLVDSPLGLTFEGTLQGLEVSIDAENIVTFDLVFNDGTPTATIKTKITTGQTELRQATNDGTVDTVALAVNQDDYILIGQKESVFANGLDNTITINSGSHSIEGKAGDDTFIVNGGQTVIDGGDGIDTAIFAVDQTTAGGVSKVGNVVVVGNGHTFLNVEYIQFSDTRIETASLSEVPVATIDQNSVTISESSAGTLKAEFTVSLSTAAAGPVGMTFATRDGSATSGADYTPVSAGSVIFAAGETQKTISFDILDDGTIEGFEGFFVDLSIDAGVTFADNSTTQTVAVGIEDDDSAVSLALVADDTRITEGNSGGTNSVTLTLDRSGDLSSEEVISWSVAATGTSSVDAADFVGGLPSGQVTFALGESTASITLDIAADTIFEGDETFSISFASVSGSATLNLPTTTFTIVDDEQTPSGPIEGTANADVLVGTSFDDMIDALEGNDTVSGGPGADTITLGAGRDTLRDTLNNFFGDRVRDFGLNDRMFFEGVQLTRDAINVRLGSAILDIDGDGDGNSDGSFTLEGDFTGGDFMAARLETGTQVTFENFLASLRNKQAVSSSDINGIVNAEFLNGHNVTDMSVTFEANARAGFDNTVGYYEIDPTGQLVNVTILAANAKTVSGPIGITVSDPDNDIGFFLVQDGADRIDPAEFTADDFEFVSDGAGGFDLASQGAVLDGLNVFFSHDASLNPDGMQHVLSGVSNDGEGALRIGFEDLLRSPSQGNSALPGHVLEYLNTIGSKNGSDDDFDDVVLYVDIL
ncbi:Calx-beta domain protein [Maliponia aquimaris]|uniref:Calx-beta domain protein n=1 Tax=Maliponia aquimaris TaxID=1673631 RepID=A0A238JRR4_9RHOB|nr:Calx-beta domain protein [Maliponia aquimaris]